MWPSCKGWCCVSEVHIHTDTQLKIRTVDEGVRGSMSMLVNAHYISKYLISDCVARFLLLSAIRVKLNLNVI